MVQIVEHRAETSVDFAVDGEAASSAPQVPNRPVPGTAAVHAARQHTAAQTSRTPSTSRNASVSGESSLPKTTPHLVADLAKKRLTTARWPRLSGTSGISHPRGT
jgi:hypothetical protein